MQFQLSVNAEVNVTVRTRDVRTGRIVHESKSHNIVINIGRKFLRDIICCNDYPTPPNVDPEVYPSVTPGGADYTPTTMEEYALTNHRVRWIAVGTGGSMQSYSYPGRGSQVEIATVKGLERPIPVARSNDPPIGEGLGGYSQRGYFWKWAKEVEPQTLLSDELPDDVTVRFRAVFGASDISFSGQVGSYGLQVPVSEFVLLTSEYSPYHRAPCCARGVVDATDGHYQVLKSDGTLWKWTPYPGGTERDHFDCFPTTQDGISGGLAYNIGSPIPKSPGVILEVEWEVTTA